MVQQLAATTHFNNTLQQTREAHMYALVNIFKVITEVSCKTSLIIILHCKLYNKVTISNVC